MKFVRTVYRQKTKNISLFGAIFRHVALLVTEISRRVCCDKCNIQRLKYTFIMEVYLCPLKHIMDNPVLIEAIFMGR